MHSEDAVFADDVDLNCNLHEELRHFGKEFYNTGIQLLMERWEKCVANEGDLVDKSSQLCEGCTCDTSKFHYNCNE